ncbi:Nitrite reductase (cytochrome; ammonia-forming) [Alkaliphilus metalliredigens QYMF]|uniref:nitrite reductase (cytochrome; ammonia-forming) n=1 Tax=Alkaliphilus metalliredigens (strain QYMF) TaxID=293826 RepID=A6TSA2_ALKMQ|nr:ammonia-forming cytochrome c nitrite reductase subunit c552 [Alkaliphilus metalliredigens]ABR49070.1 Nitrite reductase (cytochrome; ammonia-forming) [Alkaliphilus metalliredigens QYMF]
MKRELKFVVSIMVILGLLISSLGCAREEEPGEPLTPEIEDERVEVPNVGEMILSSEAWQEEYPMIYESFIRTSRYKDGVIEDPELGGLMPLDYIQEYPEIEILYDGIGFAKEYYAARGHYYALTDVINTVRPKPGASCLACKTSEYERLYVENGDDLFRMDFHETVQEIENGISCYNCHRNEPGERVQVTSPHFADAVERLDLEIPPGNMACAQCHVEYYFEPETGTIVLPWDNGIGVDEIEAYFDERDFHDWKHPRTGTPLIKVQHPEFEMYTDSLHARLGITCIDCHMPTVEEDGETYTSHWAKSPLKTVNESCGQCHGPDGDAIIADTQAIQKEIKGELAELSSMIVKLIEDFAVLVEERDLDEETLHELWSLHRKAQYRWDFVFVENSTGFHNASKARRTLEDGKEYAQQALELLEGLNNQ